MVFNPGYLGLPDFADWAEVPGLSISARLTLVPIVIGCVGLGVLRFTVTTAAVLALVAVGGGALVLLLGLALLVRESHHPGWGSAHHLAAATGALATHLWLAPVNTAQLGVPSVVALAWRARRTTLGS